MALAYAVSDPCRDYADSCDEQRTRRREGQSVDQPFLALNGQLNDTTIDAPSATEIVPAQRVSL